MTIDFGGVNFPFPYREPDKVYVGFTAVFSGCWRAMNGNPCPDCQNPSLWGNLDWNGDTYEWIEEYVRKKCALLTDVELFYCVLGGEPLDQDAKELETVHRRVMTACGRQIPTVLYTGYDEAPKPVAGYVEQYVDYLKTGAYLGDKYKVKGLSTGLATKNQKWARNTNASRTLFFLGQSKQSFGK